MTDYKTVAPGTYECTVEKVFYSLTKSTGKPMVTIWYRIKGGEFDRYMLFDRTVCSTDKAWIVAHAKLAALFPSIPEALNADNADMICNVVQNAVKEDRYKVVFKQVQGTNGGTFDRFYAAKM